MVEQLLHLSSKTLEEKDADRFIAYLLERNVLMGMLIGKEVKADFKSLRDWLDKETNILARLEKERADLLKEMDKLSINRKAIRKYSAKFPFPSMPAFIDEKG